METPVIYKHKEGVHFRKLAKGDLDILMQSKASSWAYTHGFLIPTPKSQLEWFEKIDKSETDLVLVGLISQQNMMERFGIATFYNIDRHNRSLQIGGHIFPDHRNSRKAIKGWNAGIDFAFEMLNMNRVYGEVLETNTGALKLDDLTMTREGVKRQACYQSGRYLDSVMFGLLREEWEASDRVKSYEGCCNTQVTE
jgi:RimJ/RimL family protein N-acetyltransferase